MYRDQVEKNNISIVDRMKTYSGLYQFAVYLSNQNAALRDLCQRQQDRLDHYASQETTYQSKFFTARKNASEYYKDLINAVKELKKANQKIGKLQYKISELKKENDGYRKSLLEIVL